MHVSALWVYPVKGCAGISVEQWPVGARGLRYDRHFMVVDDGGGFLTQRTHPTLALVTVEFTGDDQLAITTPAGRTEVDLPQLSSGSGRELSSESGREIDRDRPAEQRLREVKVWGFQAPAEDAGDEAADLLSAHLRQPVRLVRVPPNYPRRADPATAGVGVPVSFSDGYPLLITNEASLDALNAWLDEPLPMNRFRPNVVIADATPFAEDTWRRLHVGGIPIDLVSPCTRCAVTTVDQGTGRRDGPEPLRSLAKFRRGPDGVEFGWNAVPRSSGTLSVNEVVIRS